MRRAESDARRLRAAADDVRERTRAARAYWSLGHQSDENVAVQMAMLDEELLGWLADQIGEALADDANERERAGRLIVALLDEGVLAGNVDGLIAAVRSLVSGRLVEAREMLELLDAPGLDGELREQLLGVFDDIVSGPVDAALRLAGLLSAGAIPEGSEPGLQGELDREPARGGRRRERRRPAGGG